ncbi:sperm motility kinase [Podospora conica]|nr:sperm motility kinase [Schizothecium conicum]
MADQGDGWHTVMPIKTAGMDRLSRAQLEEYERQILREWDMSRGHWSGLGKHTGTSTQDFAEAKKLHQRLKSANDRVLGSGSYGVVEKVNHFHNNKSVCLARKHIQYRRGYSIQLLREEANVMEKLDHEHIVRLVGTYCVRPNELYILLWPVAVCNLDNLLNDLDLLRTGQGDRDDILSRLHTLDLQDTSAIERPRQPGQPQGTRGNCPLDYLRQIMGCITRAVSYCHQTNIRHLDLKPSNILLNPGRVYLADFGIAKDVNSRDHTMTMGAQGTPKWRAPEIHSSRDEWSMKAADVYSLGLVLLEIATVLYRGNLADFDVVVGDLTSWGRAEKLAQYHPRLEAMALATQEVEDANAPSFSPKHVVGLTARMLASDPSKRPVVDLVDTELVELGGIEQIYHSSCCKRSSRFVTDRMNTKYRQAVDEQNRLRTSHAPMAKRLEVLEGMEETFISRIDKERKGAAERLAHIQAQLEKERNERKRLEALVADMQQPGRRHRPSIPLPSERKPSTGSPVCGGLMMRSRRTHPLTSPPSEIPSPSLPSQPCFPTPTISFATRPTYSQTAAAAVSAPVIPTALPLRRDSVARVLSDSPGSTTVPASPNADNGGFPMRSRNSASRLPRAVNPATPIRSVSPALAVRDPSSTDSTQLSMSSSTFSRLSSSRYAESAAETSVAGTPAIGSPDVNGARRESRRPSIAREMAMSEDRPVDAQSFASGMGLGIMERRESVTSKTGSVRDAASAVAVPLSPVLTGSVLSSPRSGYAFLETQGDEPVRVPSLPTAKSWADVARRPQAQRVQ